MMFDQPVPFGPFRGASSRGFANPSILGQIRDARNKHKDVNSLTQNWSGGRLGVGGSHTSQMMNLSSICLITSPKFDLSPDKFSSSQIRSTNTQVLT